MFRIPEICVSNSAGLVFAARKAISLIACPAITVGAFLKGRDFIMGKRAWNFQDLTGQRFGRLTVIELDCTSKDKDTWWICRCDCGEFTTVRASVLKKGATKSCGCLKYDNLEGMKFGRLTVLERDCDNGRKGTHWICKCDCGNYAIVTTGRLKRGQSKSCGCINREKHTKHGMIKTRMYNIWMSMKQRCADANCKSYKDYGGRGIKVCDEWVNDFQAFYDWAMANGYRDNLSIDRIDVNGDYEPDNCRWVTRKTQNNNSRKNRYYSYNGETHTIAEWSEIMGIGYSALYARIERGWTIERALTQKPKS